MTQDRDGHSFLVSEKRCAPERDEKAPPVVQRGSPSISRRGRYDGHFHERHGDTPVIEEVTRSDAK